MTAGRTRTAGNAVLGAPRTGCGPETVRLGKRTQKALIEDQAFLVSQKILSIWAM
ncbi:hypothetical protein ACVILE_002240 [Streptomyces sp. M18.1]